MRPEASLPLRLLSPCHAASSHATQSTPGRSDGFSVTTDIAKPTTAAGKRSPPSITAPHHHLPEQLHRPALFYGPEGGERA
jgi:hypothetical protein